MLSLGRFLRVSWLNHHFNLFTATPTLLSRSYRLHYLIINMLRNATALLREFQRCKTLFCYVTKMPKPLKYPGWWNILGGFLKPGGTPCFPQEKIIFMNFFLRKKYSFPSVPLNPHYPISPPSLENLINTVVFVKKYWSVKTAGYVCIMSLLSVLVLSQIFPHLTYSRFTSLP